MNIEGWNNKTRDSHLSKKNLDLHDLYPDELGPDTNQNLALAPNITFNGRPRASATHPCPALI